MNTQWLKITVATHGIVSGPGVVGYVSRQSGPGTVSGPGVVGDVSRQSGPGLCATVCCYCCINDCRPNAMRMNVVSGLQGDTAAIDEMAITVHDKVNNAQPANM